MKRSKRYQFAFKLAMMAGILDVDWMLRRLPAPMFRKWEMYDELQPFGDFRADARAASIVGMIHNVAVREKDRKSNAEFLLPWSKPEKDEETEQVKMPDGTIITEQIWYAMNIAAMNAAGAFDETKVMVDEGKT